MGNILHWLNLVTSLNDKRYFIMINGTCYSTKLHIHELRLSVMQLTCHSLQDL